MRTVVLLWLLTGCAPGVPGQYLAIDGDQGEYALTEVEIPELEDPFRMQGSLGNGTVGGYVAGSLFAGEIDGYAGGGPIRLDYAIEDGVGVPFSADGVILWSYYHSLSEIRAELDEIGVDTDEVFPVPFAYQPSFAGAALTSNAAYAGDVIHLFILLPDGGDRGIPLAANPGVIRHEFGHALFQEIVVGQVSSSLPYDPVQNAAPAALNEGFADIVATLSLDDPDFITPSIDLGGARDVSGDHRLEDTVDPSVDPYSRGTVYASFAWDVRIATDDPQLALRLAIGALEDWAAQEAWQDEIAGIDRYPGLFADRVLGERPGLTGPVCDAFARRFGSLVSPTGCP